MAAIDVSEYEQIELVSVDGSETIDIRLGVTSFNYYEDIFSPIITAIIQIVNDSNSFNGESIYKGLPLQAGETVLIKIKGNTKSNPGLDFSKKGQEFYVDKVTNVLMTTDKEIFTLHLVSKESIRNEISRVTQKYPTSSAISASVEKILQDILKTDNTLDIEQTSNKYGFIGNMRKPFTVINWLMSKAVPDSEEGDATAGYLFWQTREGINFKSIDGLINQDPVNDGSPYVYDEITTKVGRNTDFKILEYEANRNQNLLEKLRIGTYASNRIFFNPLTGNFTGPQQGNYKLENYKGKSKNLGRELDLPLLDPDTGDSVGDIPSRIVTQVLDVGTFETDVSKKGNADPMKYQSQTLMRYNTLLTQITTMTIPSNTNLKAGDVIDCKFPGKNNEPNMEISGLYMIKELCHYFDRKGSWSSLTLIRDTFGQYGTNSK